ncbi:hypothetical protein ACTXT7_008112 [Hymenolepis weldensis]
MDSFDPPNIITKPAAESFSDAQKTQAFPYVVPRQIESWHSLFNPYPSFPYYPYSQYPYPQSCHFMPRPIPYDPSTPFSQWFSSTDLLLSQYPGTYKMNTLLSALPKDTRLWLQLKGITENSDYNSVKPILLNLMSITKKPKTMMGFHRRRQQPGESYAQFGMSLQAILAETMGDRFSLEDQEYLVSTRFTAQVYPPDTAGACGHCGACQGSRYVLHNRGKPLTSPPPQPKTHNQPKLGWSYNYFLFARKKSQPLYKELWPLSGSPIELSTIFELRETSDIIVPPFLSPATPKILHTFTNNKKSEHKCQNICFLDWIYFETNSENSLPETESQLWRRKCVEKGLDESEELNTSACENLLSKSQVKTATEASLESLPKTNSPLRRTKRVRKVRFNLDLLEYVYEYIKDEERTSPNKRSFPKRQRKSAHSKCNTPIVVLLEQWSLAFFSVIVDTPPILASQYSRAPEEDKLSREQRRTRARLRKAPNVYPEISQTSSQEVNTESAACQEILNLTLKEEYFKESYLKPIKYDDE